MPFLSDKPLGDDGYYMLSIAWNSIDAGALVYAPGHPTTGLQPLCELLYMGLAGLVRVLGGDRWMFARVVLLVCAGTLLLLAHLLGRIAAQLAKADARPAAYTWGILLTAFNFYAFREATFGVETGLYLALIALCVLQTVRSGGSLQGAAVFGSLLGLTWLCRLDFGLVLAALLLLTVVRKPDQRRRALITGLIACAWILPWLLFVHHQSGRWLPSSGPSQMAWINATDARLRLRQAAIALLCSFAPWIYVRPGGLVALAGAASFASMAVWIRSALAGMWSRPAMKTLMMWALALVPLLVVYPLLFWVTHFYHRYFAPLLVVAVPTMAVGLAAQLRGRRRALRVAAYAIMPALFAIMIFMSFHTGRVNSGLTVTAGYVLRHIAPSARVGSFQCGRLGYFRANVVNLDGKVDGQALAFLERGRLDQYVDQERIDVLVDVGYLFTKHFDRHWLATAFRPCDVPMTVPGSRCYQRR